MYNLPHHKESDPQIVKQFIAKYPFAFLSGCDADNKPIATQVPLFIEELEGKKFLRGHIMKDTDHHKAFLLNKNVLVVFTGHHTYVSGTWYTNPHTPSTWNYMSVHAKGAIRFLEDTELENVLRKTSLHFENFDPTSSTVFDNLPADFIKRATPYIVAFEIEIMDLDTVFKLSQDRNLESYRNIIVKLREQGEAARVIADEMEKRTQQVFPREASV